MLISGLYFFSFTFFPMYVGSRKRYAKLQARYFISTNSWRISENEGVTHNKALKLQAAS